MSPLLLEVTAGAPHIAFTDNDREAPGIYRIQQMGEETKLLDNNG
jgi:hypothetical protein